MNNYDEAKDLVNRSSTYTAEGNLEKALVLSNLALVDEMRKACETETKEVFLLIQFRVAENEEREVMHVYKDRAKAYEERDALNELAVRVGDPFRYIIKEKEIQ
jgi:hypothetical protein